MALSAAGLKAALLTELANLGTVADASKQEAFAEAIANAVITYITTNATITTTTTGTATVGSGSSAGPWPVVGAGTGTIS